jgi:hypothetical protein
MFLKNVVLHEIYSKKSQWPNTFGTSLYIQDEERILRYIKKYIEMREAMGQPTQWLLIWPDQDLNPHSNALKTSMLTIYTIDVDYFWWS